MKVLKIVCAMGLAAMFACGDDDDGGTTYDAPPTTQFDAKPADAGAGFQQPSGTVAVNFTVDDTANKVYQAGDLEWKGSMNFNSTTRTVTKDEAWGGPFALLYDDGPWTTGGHEPVGNVSGDNKWGVTIFITPPATGSTAFGYGLNDVDYNALPRGNGWSWIGSDGSFSVAAGATTPITAQGQTFLKFGTTDLQIELDVATAMAAANGPWDTSVIGIKSSAWGWGVHTVTPSGGKATLVLSTIVGSGKKYNHSGLLNAGQKPEFIWVLGTGDGKEYKLADGNAQTAGVTAGTKASGAATFTPVTVMVGTNKNTFVTVP